MLNPNCRRRNHGDHAAQPGQPGEAVSRRRSETVGFGGDEANVELEQERPLQYRPVPHPAQPETEITGL